jgi:predicted nucleic acid-binding protein
MTILDTNVLSELMRQVPNPGVISWLDQQPRTSIWTTSITILEIQFGLRILASGKRRAALMLAFEVMLEKIEHRIAAFDYAAALVAGDLMAARQKKGRRGDLRDTMIAGIALAHHASLATHNTAHFADLSVALVDPWVA